MEKNNNEKEIYKLKTKMLSRVSKLNAINNPIHTHDKHYELEIVISGNGEMPFNEKLFTLKKGDIYLMRPLDYHGHKSNGLTFRQIEIQEDLMPKWALKKAFALNNPLVFHTNEDEFQTITNLMTLLEKELEFEKNHYENISLSIIELLFTYFFRLNNENKEEIDDKTSKVIYYICQNNKFLENISLDSIAKEVGYSKYYISSIFHKNYGKTIQDFIISQRLEYARKLLIQTKMPISEIIYESGFSTISNFYAQFEKAYGIAPQSFRNKYQK